MDCKGRGTQKGKAGAHPVEDKGDSSIGYIHEEVPEDHTQAHKYQPMGHKGRGRKTKVTSHGSCESYQTRWLDYKAHQAVEVSRMRQLVFHLAFPELPDQTIRSQWLQSWQTPQHLLGCFDRRLLSQNLRQD